MKPQSRAIYCTSLWPWKRPWQARWPYNYTLGPRYHSCGNIKGKRVKFPKRKGEKGKRRDLLVLWHFPMIKKSKKSPENMFCTISISDKYLPVLQRLGDTVLNLSAKNCCTHHTDAAYKNNIFQLSINNQLPKKNLAYMMLCQCIEGNHRVQIEPKTSNQWRLIEIQILCLANDLTKSVIDFQKPSKMNSTFIHMFQTPLWVYRTSQRWEKANIDKNIFG